MIEMVEAWPAWTFHVLNKGIILDKELIEIIKTQHKMILTINDYCDTLSKSQQELSGISENMIGVIKDIQESLNKLEQRIDRLYTVNLLQMKCK